jgi:phosphatidylglycerophosphate synthase
MVDISAKEVRENFQLTKGNEPLHHQLFFWISPYITSLLVKTKITPNQVSMFWILLGTLGFILIGFGEYKLAVLGVVLYHIAQLFDYVDGEMARTLGKKTIGGVYLDEIAQVLHRSLLLVMAGLGVYNAGYGIFYLHIGWISSFLFMFKSTFEDRVRLALFNNKMYKMAIWKKESYAQKQKRKKRDSILFLLRPAEPFNLFFIFIVLNMWLWLGYLLVLQLVIVVLMLSKSIVSTYKKTGNFPPR